VSKLGGAIAFVAEAGIWVAGAALVASAAGAHWDTPQVDFNTLLGPAKSPSTSGSPGPSATASASIAPAPTGQLNFARAAELHANLAALTQASGAITGTLRVASTSSKITGSIGFNASGSSIAFNQDGKAMTSEIVAGGTRYLRFAAGPWVNHGPKQKDATLAATLGGADSSSDIGIQAFAGKQLHRIESPIASLNVAEGLGLDTSQWVNPTGTFRVWADDAGVAVGFGASLLWSQANAGHLVDCRLEIDVKFDTKPKVSVAAPKDSWAWITDNSEGISYAVPAKWVKDAKPASPYAFTYTASDGKLAEYSLPAQSQTLDFFVGVYTDALTAKSLKAGNAVSADLAGESATVVPTSTSRYTVAVLAIHANRIYTFVFVGNANAAASAKLYGGILDTIRWTS
jgi:hypothetical protein